MSPHKPHPVIRWAVILMLLAGLIASSVVALRYARLSAETAASVARIEAQGQAFRAKAEQLALENENLRRQLGIPPSNDAEARKLAHEREQHLQAMAARVEVTRELEKLQESLVAANSKTAGLETRNQEMEAAVEKLTVDNQRLTASEEELKERLAGTNRIVEAMQAELKGRDERATEIEIASRALREQIRKLSEKSGQSAVPLRDLEEINHRREVLLNNILRRYRDLTDQYRVLAANTDRSREGLGSGGADLSRLQNAISLAEDDLRQLNTLNSQAARIQQRLRSK